MGLGDGQGTGWQRQTIFQKTMQEGGRSRAPAAGGPRDAMAQNPYAQVLANFVAPVLEDSERVALMDTNTNVYNIKMFKRTLEYELKRGKRYKRPVAVLLVGVDGYGDEVRQTGQAEGLLKLVGQELCKCIRDVDIPARFSHDQFAVILPETNAAGGMVVADRICTKIRGEYFGQSPVTVSVAVASFPGHARDYPELMDRVTRALQLAVEQGGNCPVMAGN